MGLNFDEGAVLLIDKPYRWTSFDVVSKLRNTLKVKKIGHAGTLDPLATGLLILCTGKKTKQIDYYQGLEKEYTGKLVVGKTTPSVDLETEFDQTYPTGHISETDVYRAATTFMGAIQQIPPMYSAIRVNGKRLYKKARKGEIIEIQPREVYISAFEITGIEFPEIYFRVICSKGTYIRSLVRDFGEALQSGAYLAELRRTRIGTYSVAEAQTVEQFIATYQQPL